VALRYAKWIWGGLCFAVYLAAAALFFDGGTCAAFVLFSGLFVMSVVWAVGLGFIYLGRWIFTRAEG